MKTIDLKKGNPSIDEILAMAKSDSVLIEGIDGSRYVLEEADEFEQEVAAFGESQKFMMFLEENFVLIDSGHAIYVRELPLI